MKSKGNLKKLVRNLRVTKNEKIIHIGNTFAISKRDESQKSRI